MKKKSKKEKPADPRVESEYFTEVTWTCPARGKVTEKVKIKRLKPQAAPVAPNPFDLEILKEVVGTDDEN